ncbi:MAG: hypothetical protein F2915_05155 [Actinobacteria bacterium]|nr:hypothetical protein [Actinomycetota bacterium]
MADRQRRLMLQPAAASGFSAVGEHLGIIRPLRSGNHAESQIGVDAWLVLWVSCGGAETFRARLLKTACELRAVRLASMKELECHTAAEQDQDR